MSKTRSKFQTESIKKAWPMVRLGEVCEVRAGADYKDVEDPNGRYPIYGTGGIMGRASRYRCPAHSVIVGRKGTLDNPFLVHEPFWNIDTCFGVVPSERIVPEYLFRFCQGFDFYSLVPASGRPSTTSDAVRAIEIPLPPLSVQREIVARLEREIAAVEKMKKGFEALAETAKAEFKAELKEAFEEISRRGAETRRLGEVLNTGAGGTPLKQHRDYYDGGNIPWLRSGEVCKKDITETELFITAKGMENSSAKLFPRDSVVVAMYGATAGQVGILRIESTTNQAVCAIFPSSKHVSEFLYYQLLGMKKEMVSQAQGGAQPNISQIKIKNLQVCLPPLSAQREVVARLDGAKAKAEKLEAKAREGAAVCETMRKAILKEAFSSFAEATEDKE